MGITALPPVPGSCNPAGNAALLPAGLDGHHSAATCPHHQPQEAGFRAQAPPACSAGPFRASLGGPQADQGEPLVLLEVPIAVFVLFSMMAASVFDECASQDAAPHTKHCWDYIVKITGWPAMQHQATQ